MEQDSVEILARLRGGDQQAANELFHRYIDRLMGMARNRLSERLAQRVDAEDIVQSVYRSFFHRAKLGQYEVQRAGDLWRLLATITVNKVRGQAQHHRKQKRNLDREQALGNEVSAAAEIFASDPEENDAIAVIDELQHVMEQLPAGKRDVLEMRLKGHSVTEISQHVDRTERTVRRILEESRHILEQRLLREGEE